MKSFRSIKSRLFVSVGLAALLFAQSRASAQIPGASGGGATAIMNVVILKLFGGNTNFISKLEVHILDKNQQETGSVPLVFERLGDKVRYDINLAVVKSRELSPELIATMKEMGMDHLVAVRLSEKGSIVSIYPGLKAYAESPIPREEMQAATNHFNIEKAPVGHETIDGHPCEKNTVTVTEANGHKDHIIVWYATDIKGFPLQMQIPADDTTLIFKFKDVKLGRPELNHFDAPAGMTKYPDVNALMAQAVAKKTGTPPAK